MGNFIAKGNIVYTKKLEKFEIFKDSFIVVKSGMVEGVFENLPKKYLGMEIKDYGDKIIIPGFNDIHLHAGQYKNIGLGLDKELIPWLETYTFPEEEKFKEKKYAEKVYKNLINDIWTYGNTRSVIFATLHRESTELLFDLYKKSKLGAYIGKVNMDRMSPDFLIEKTEDSIKETRMFIRNVKNSSYLVKPILTPRFVPTCTPKLMDFLGDFARENEIPIQSHLDENQEEIEFVKELHPDSKNYSSIYKNYGLFGDGIKTIMAHCVYNSEEEIEMLKDKDIFVAHCPNSNLNLSSGIAPIRRYLKEGINVGLGSDISGGHTLSMMNNIVSALQTSKLYEFYKDNNLKMLSFSEAFYLATKGGGSFFGKVGSFESGYSFDALIIDDLGKEKNDEKNLEERLQRFIHLDDPSLIIERFVEGVRVPKPF